MKLVVSDAETGKTYQTELEEEKTAYVKGKKMGEKIEGNLVGAPGYIFEITGGSDKSGFPMRADIPGSRKVRAFLGSGPGFNPKEKGERKKKMVMGNEISEQIVQINTKVVQKGQQPLEELFGKKEEKKE
ncbi:30S ribosomal protein S6e [Candidatus Micrarchaeota archaeon]|nr:30S ribosomal protein S6e [Candidatus Micrarchaeota archaeon]